MNKQIIRQSIHSTKKWLYHYILDKLPNDDPNHDGIESAIKDIYQFQDDILLELKKDDDNDKAST